MAEDKLEDRLAEPSVGRCSVGLTASVVLIVLGGFFSVKKVPPENFPDTGFFALPARAMHGDGTAILELGLLVLMLTARSPRADSWRSAGPSAEIGDSA